MRKVYLVAETYWYSATVESVIQGLGELIGVDIEEIPREVTDLEQGSVVLFLDLLNPKILECRLKIIQNNLDVKLAAIFLGYPKVADPNESQIVNLEKALAESVDLLVFPDKENEVEFTEKRFVRDDHFVNLHTEFGTLNFPYLSKLLENL